MQALKSSATNIVVPFFRPNVVDDNREHSSRMSGDIHRIHICICSLFRVFRIECIQTMARSAAVRSELCERNRWNNSTLSQQSKHRPCPSPRFTVRNHASATDPCKGFRPPFDYVYWIGICLGGTVSVFSRITVRMPSLYDTSASALATFWGNVMFRSNRP